ncbi:MAG: 2OG-Fe(II) oxygenase [Polyangiales bacterium]|nr:2OG-Fe(II) oxygenase [Myxococcales bacterium]
MTKSLLVTDAFSKDATALRKVFDDRFREPRDIRPDRFVWDYWHVPDQYTFHRTPAWEYFPTALYERFHRQLVMWGRRVLGCHDISPPWLSYYVDGSEQSLHGDLPHGPWAFVYSLTPSTKAFRGGETMLLRPEVLDYWRGFVSERSVELREVVDLVAPKWNRLVAFDPRVPHGVRRVEGTRDPREGRLVIHGWFVEPRPFVEGPLRRSDVVRFVEALSDVVGDVLARGVPVAGVMSVRIDVAASGEVRRVARLTDTTRTPVELESELVRLRSIVMRTARAHRFPKRREGSTVTLPLVFARG